MPETLSTEFSEFLATVPVHRLKHNTFRALLYFYKHRSEGGMPDHIPNLLADLILVIELLDNISREVDTSL